MEDAASARGGVTGTAADAAAATFFPSAGAPSEVSAAGASPLSAKLTNTLQPAGSAIEPSSRLPEHCIRGRGCDLIVCLFCFRFL